MLLLNATAATCHIVDVRARHGVFVGLVTTDALGALLGVLADRLPVMPRTGRVAKTELGTIAEVDENICRILGCEPTDLIGVGSLDLIHPDDHVRALDAWMEMLSTPGSTVRLRIRHRRADGSWLWMELTNVNRLGYPEGQVLTEMIDVSAEMEALDALRHSEQLLRRLAEALPSGVLHVDARRNVVFANARLRDVVGVEGVDTVEQLISTVIPEDRPTLEALLTRVLVDGSDADLEVRLRPPDTATLHLCAIALRGLTDAAGAPDGAVLCIDDVTESAELRAELERRATVDDLTGCFNRATVLAELDRVLRRHAAGSPGTAVVYLDLDEFKEVNDVYGHESGDQLLSSVVRRLSRLLRTGDVIGRLGGDEFIVVLSSIDGVDEAAHVGRRIKQALTVPLEVVSGSSMRIRASIGVAWSAAINVTAAALTAAADRAMYESKRAGHSEPVCVAVS